MGRVIDPTIFDQDQDAEVEDLKFYYDGSNVIAEFRRSGHRPDIFPDTLSG